MNFFDLKNIVDKVKFVKVHDGHNAYIREKKLREALEKTNMIN